MRSPHDSIPDPQSLNRVDELFPVQAEHRHRNDGKLWWRNLALTQRFHRVIWNKCGRIHLLSGTEPWSAWAFTWKQQNQDHEGSKRMFHSSWQSAPEQWTQRSLPTRVGWVDPGRCWVPPPTDSASTLRHGCEADLQVKANTSTVHGPLRKVGSYLFFECAREVPLPPEAVRHF